MNPSFYCRTSAPTRTCIPIRPSPCCRVAICDWSLFRPSDRTIERRLEADARPTMQKPGLNRLMLELIDLTSTLDTLRRQGVRFRNEIATGVGGQQIMVRDPSGNPIQLFEPQ